MSENNDQVTVKADAAAPKGSALQRAFKQVAGVSISGSLLTTGIGMFVKGAGYSSQTVGAQLVDLTAMFASSMSVWTLACAVGAAGWSLGRKFDDAASRFKPRAVAAGVGMALIAAAFSVPHSGKVYDAVHDTLSGAKQETGHQGVAPPRP